MIKKPSAEQKWKKNGLLIKKKKNKKKEFISLF